MPETQEIQKVEVNVPTPILDAINLSLSKLFKKNLAELANDVNCGIERGVKTDETAREADIVSEDGHKAVRVVTEIRLQYTRPIDEGKKALMREVESLLSPLSNPLKILDELRLERVAEIKRKEAEAKRKFEEEQCAAEEKARKEEERRRKISVAQGGNGNHKPVVVEQPVQPVSQIGMRSTTRTRSIPDREAIKLAVSNGMRAIPGVRIYQVWLFEITDSKEVPEEYRKLGRG